MPGKDSRLTGRRRDWLLGGALLAGLFGWVHWQVGWATLLAPWRLLAPGELLGLLAVALLSYLARGVRLYRYFPALLRGHLAATLRLSALHNFANNLLPMRLGEATMPLLMYRYFGHRITDSALALLWIRLLDLHVLAVIALFAGWLANGSAAWLWALAAGFVVLPLGYRLRGWLTGRLADRPGRAMGFARALLAALPDHGGRFAEVYGWTLLTWLSKFVAFTLVLQHFTGLPLWQAVAGVIGAELSSVLPIHGVAGAGSYEAALVLALAPLGVDSAVALTGAVNLHLFLLGVTLLLGPLALLLPRPKHDV